MLITGAGNIINDVFDIEIDRINKPNRPLPSKNITIRDAKIFYLITMLVGLSFSVFVSMTFFAIALLNAVVLTVYSWKLKKMHFIGNVAVAWLAASTFLAAGLINISLFTNSLWILTGISLVGTVGREILKDIEDVKGDKKQNARTLPIVIGKTKAKIFASAMLLLACALLIVPYILAMFSIYYLFIAVMPVLLCLYAIAKKNPAKSQKAVKLAMLFVMIAFIIGSFL